jgi:hypothetical protein
MKKMLPQADAPSTDAEPLSCSGGYQAFLHARHFRGGGRGFVVKAVKMKKTMRDVQTQLMFEGCPPAPRLLSRGFGTDKDLAMLKRNHVRRPAKVQETVMQFRYAPIRNQDHVQLIKAHQFAGFLPRKLVTRLENTPRERLQGHEIDAYGPLPVMQSDRGCRTRCFVRRLHFTRAHEPHTGGRVSA